LPTPAAAAAAAAAGLRNPRLPTWKDCTVDLEVTLSLQSIVTLLVTEQEKSTLEVVTPQWLALAQQRKSLAIQRAELEAIEKEKEERRQRLLSSDNLRSLGRLSAADEQALVEAEEANISDELKKLRAAQAAAKAEAELRARFRRLRRERKKSHQGEVVDLLNKMCIAVELASEFGDNPLELLPEIEDDYDLEQGQVETESNPRTPRPDSKGKKKKKKRKKKKKLGGDDGQEGEEEDDDDDDNDDDEDGATVATSTNSDDPDATKNRSGANNANAPSEEDEDPVLGCEVTFMLIVTDKERSLPGLEDLEAEDIAVMLLQQFDDPKSQLRTGGYLGQRLLDVEYKTPFRKQLFHSWESFWVHVISPVFFYRTAAKSTAKKEKESDGRLESGLMMVNPTSEFSERSKETFLMYQQKYARKPKAVKPGAPVDAEAAALAEQIKKKAEAKSQRKKRGGPQR